MGMAEGLESGLSARALFAVPDWAAASAERLPAVALPPIVRSVLYFGDADRAGARALEKLRAARADHIRLQSKERPAKCPSTPGRASPVRGCSPAAAQSASDPTRTPSGASSSSGSGLEHAREQPIAAE
ncbi:toprim domain-containing protein [Bradyrhizobium brasilense]